MTDMVNPLTGLPGMHTFHDKLTALVTAHEKDEKYQNYAIVYFNIANFKMYNRTFGMRQGDRLLKKVASTIVHTFDDALVGHIAADNFIALLPKTDLFEKLEAICNTVDATIGDSSVSLKAGVHFVAGPEKLSSPASDRIEALFDMAKIAADDIKDDWAVSVRVYTEAMGEAAATRAFVLRSFDAALAAGHIKVYFQPVVRTLTEKLCGFEALARWDDPERGLISPGAFIPVLEETKLITKLDCNIIEQVGKLMHKRLAAGEAIVPVSVNLSKVDFEMTDPLEVVEDIVKRYDLPRDYLHIEVTETVMAWNQTRLIEVLGKFHDAGYQVWLDDFGSEYSSLRFLHHFHFDELKIDMEFFRNFNEKSKQIIKSVVLMAKSLGMQTLAEGVETAEQVAFLKAVGCGKIQGFYYGRPLPFPETVEASLTRAKGFETPIDKHLFDKTELINIITDASTALFIYNGKYPTMLVENAAYLAEAASAGIGDIPAQNVFLAAKDSAMRTRFKRFFDRVGASEDDERLLYAVGGQYMSLKAKKIAGTPEYFVGVSHLYNISFSEKRKRVNLLDRAMRGILAFFDGVYYLDVTADTIHAITSGHVGLAEDKTYQGIKASLAVYAAHFVHPNDTARFISYADPDMISHRFENADESAVTDIFRVKGSDGDYHLTVYHATLLGRTAPHDILVSEERNAYELTENQSPAVKTRFLKAVTDMVGDVPDIRKDQKTSDQAALFAAMKKNSPTKFFWKDKDRRFLGASDAFLRYYGFPDESAIIGKTDEDIGWHTDNAPFREAEEDIVSHGARHAQIGTSTSGGRPRKIVASKFPFYHGNHIAGLMGVFDDVETGVSEKQERFITDERTGVLSYYGMVLAGLKYRESYDENGEDFAVALITVPSYTGLLKTYGGTFATALLRRIKDEILKDSTHGLTVARLESAYFVVFWKGDDRPFFDQKLEEALARIAAIRTVNGVSVSLYPAASAVWGSETTGFDDMSRTLAFTLQETLAERRAAADGESAGDHE